MFESFLLLMLASASKSRHYLLKKMGIDHLVMASDLDEENFEKFDAPKMVEELALAKANAVASKLVLNTPEDSIYKQIDSVLGCDSVFVFQGEICGKPKDYKEAIERLQRMSSNSGFLITGHALLFRPAIFESRKEFSFNGLIQKVVSTRVDFVDMTYEEIDQYVSTGEPLHCAGGFALEGRGGMLISAINGCYSNVIGLSLPWLKKAMYVAGLG